MAGNKRWGWVRVLMFVLAVAAIAAAVAYTKRPKNVEIDFRISPVERGDVVQSVTANGQLTPVVDIEVGSQVSGIIKHVYVDFNSRVTNGQVIAQIDPEAFEASVMQAEAELANTQASLELAQINARRAGELYKASLIPRADYDTAMATLHQAEAVVKIREASLKRARTDFERTTIYAPIDGVVISRNIEEGQTVASSFNTPKLFQIAADLTKMEIEAMVSEADVGGVEEGQAVTFTVDAFPSRQFRGTVRQVRFAATTNQNVVTYTSVVEVNNQDLKLRPGMTANAAIITAERKDALRIPNAALRFRPPETSILKPDAPASGAATNKPAPAADGEAPVPPWVAEGRQAPGGPDEIRKWMDSLTPEQREAARAQFRRRMGGGEGPGGGRGMRGGAERAAAPEGPVTRTLYLSENVTSPSGKPITMAKPVTVRLGITDGSYTEVMSGLKEGDLVIAGANTPVTSATAPGAQQTSPFGRQGFRGR